MSTTESPLVDILAQLRERAESWSREAASARAALAEEVAVARQQLASDTPEAAAQRTNEAAASLQAELDAANARGEAVQVQLSSAQRDVAELRVAVDHARGEASALKAAASGKVDAAELSAAKEEIARLHAAHREALNGLEKQISSLVSALAESKAEIARLHQEAGRAEAAKTLTEDEIRAFDTHGHKRRMGTILVEAGILTQDQLDAALAEQAANPQRRVGAIVVERGLTSEEVVARILAAQLRLPFVTLAPGTYDAVAASKISAHLARLHKSIPLSQSGEMLCVAMANPLDLIAIEDIEIASRCRVEPVVATKSSIEAVLAGLI